MKTHRDRIRDSITDARSRANSGDWRADQHILSWVDNRNDFATATRMIVEGLALHADAHRAQFNRSIIEGVVLGWDSWKDIAEGLRVLLNGELGPLDTKTVDALLKSMLQAEGFETE